MIAGYSVAGSAESFVTGGTEYSVPGGVSFGGTSLVDSAYHYPNPLRALPHFCKWGNAIPMNISLWPA